MQPAFIALGKTGDILSCIALAQHRFPTFNLVTSAKGATVAAGISGVTVHIYPGQWDDLHGAIRWAKQRFKHVIAVQTYGKDFPIEHRRPSFQLDQALRAGVRDWENVRLKLGAHNEIKKDGSIFFADTSQSSPFRNAGDLGDLLRHRFGKDRSVVLGSKIQLRQSDDIYTRKQGQENR